MKKNIRGHKPTVTIIGSIHGNEKIGALAIKRLKRIIKNEKISGKINFILGNPYAYKKNKRFLRHDMNRLFKPSGVELGKKPFLEQKRAYKISKILDKTDFMLDIHSTQKPSVPFVYCKLTPQHLALARIFETKFIVGPSKNFKTTTLNACTDDYVNSRGGIGITYESGWNRDLKNLKKVIQKTKEFLKTTGAVFLKKIQANPAVCGERCLSCKPFIIKLYKEVIPKTNSFSLAKDFKNFDFVKKGGLIGYDKNRRMKLPAASRGVFCSLLCGEFHASARREREQGEQSGSASCEPKRAYKIKAEYDSFIIFPKTQFIIGKPACYLGRRFKRGQTN